MLLPLNCVLILLGFPPPFYAGANVFSLGNVKECLTLLQIMHENNHFSK